MTKQGCDKVVDEQLMLQKLRLLNIKTRCSTSFAKLYGYGLLYWVHRQNLSRTKTEETRTSSGFRSLVVFFSVSGVTAKFLVTENSAKQYQF
jgi:hypothetical protein